MCLVGGIAPGDMHGLGGRETAKAVKRRRKDRRRERKKKKPANERRGRKVTWRKGKEREKGPRLNQTSHPTVSHRGIDQT